MSYSRLLYYTSPLMYGADIKEVQRKLNELGFNCGSVDGYYGSKTKAAVKSFQRAKGLGVDGIVGPKTWEKLFNTSSSAGVVTGAVKAATQWMINLANDDDHGYDQAHRWGEYGDYDCSSAVITAWQEAGVTVKDAGASYTGNMKNAFIQCGFVDVTSSINLSSGSGLEYGDVLLNTRNHTAMYIGNNKLVHASINEKGGVTGGKPGDQTGKEIYTRSYYNYPWNYVLRYDG